MVPITCSCRSRCRMSSSCLTYFVVPLSGSVRLPAVPSFTACLLACLVTSCSLARPASLPASLLVGRDAWRYASALFAIADFVLMSCGCHAADCLFLGSLTSRLCQSPRSLDTVGGEGSWCRRCLFLSDFCCLPLSLACGSDGSGLLACSYGRRSFPSCDVRVRGFCGSRSLRLPWLLRHGILSLCREGG